MLIASHQIPFTLNCSFLPFKFLNTSFVRGSLFFLIRHCSSAVRIGRMLKYHNYIFATRLDFIQSEHPAVIDSMYTTHIIWQLSRCFAYHFKATESCLPILEVSHKLSCQLQLPVRCLKKEKVGKTRGLSMLMFTNIGLQKLKKIICKLFLFYSL